MFSRSWRLFRESWSVLQADKELVTFPVLSAVWLIIASALFLAVIAIVAVANPELVGRFTEAQSATGAEQSDPVATALGILILFLYYLIFYFIVNYMTTALIGAALIRFEGGDPTVRDGLRIARSRTGIIFGYSAIAATVGVLLSILRSRSREGGNVGGQIIAGLGEFAWGVATFLVIPVLAAKGVGPIQAIRESASLLRKTWGEQLIGMAGLGLILGIPMFLIILLAGFGVFALASAEAPLAAVLAVVILALLLVAALAAINSALGGIYRAAIYRYADTGAAPAQFDSGLIANSFRTK